MFYNLGFSFIWEKNSLWVRIEPDHKYPSKFANLFIQMVAFIHLNLPMSERINSFDIFSAHIIKCQAVNVASSSTKRRNTWPVRLTGVPVSLSRNIIGTPTYKFSITDRVFETPKTWSVHHSGYGTRHSWAGY